MDECPAGTSGRDRAGLEISSSTAACIEPPACSGLPRKSSAEGERPLLEQEQGESSKQPRHDENLQFRTGVIKHRHVSGCNLKLQGPFRGETACAWQCGTR